MRKHETHAYTMINALFIHPLFIKIKRLKKGSVVYTHTQHQNTKTRTGKEPDKNRDLEMSDKENT